MAVVGTHPERIDGPWIEGFVLDKHEIKSVPIGYFGEHMQFDTTRSALGELLYQFRTRVGRQRTSSRPIAAMRVLIVDDLWQTGGTLRRVAEVLKEMGAAEIRALVMTRTK